jgi:exopolysaccharide biosynthesis protein
VTRPLAARADWLPSMGLLDELIGGWPVILRDGAPVVDESAMRELTGKSNANVRHPRSLIGFDADTSHLVLVVIDGRSAASVGMTLAEVAEFLRGQGVAHALNLDGGGSSALVIDGRIVNVPSDPGGERTVANALLIEAVIRRP